MNLENSTALPELQKPRHPLVMKQLRKEEGIQVGLLKMIMPTYFDHIRNAQDDFMLKPTY